MRNENVNKSTKKETGRIYTPAYIVDNILNMSGYFGKKILKKHVIDNSCGDGAFLCQIVDRYCQEALKSQIDIEDLKNELSFFIHGIEINLIEKNKCVQNVSKVAANYGVSGVNWDIVCADSLSIDLYNGKMDFVLGNPPYVRVHNLGANFEKTKSFSFSQNGMTDLFIVFFEIGLNMLSENGVLGYITPSSYFNSLAGSYLRRYLADNNLIKYVLDLKHYQAFDATAYTAITILQNGKRTDETDYYNFDEINKIPYYVDTLRIGDFYISDNYYFTSTENLNRLHNIFNNPIKSDICVKNGYATLCDSVFIGDFDYSSEYIIPVVKSSKGVFQKIIYPYDKSANPVDEKQLKKDIELYKYLLSNKDKLTKRSNDRTGNKYWYAYGRSQAINDTYKNKLSINTLIRDENDLKFVFADAGIGVYSGLYILSENINYNDIISALKTKDFVQYIKVLGKYKSGGYYTFSSKDVKTYLDYIFACKGGLYAYE